MINLLRANITKLLKDTAFRICNVFMFFFGVFIVITHYIDGVNYGFSPYDAFAYSNSVIMLFPLATFAAMFIGREYSNGTIRNKLIAGHSRVHIYLVNLITLIVASIIMCVCWYIPVYSLGSILLLTADVSWLTRLVQIGLILTSMIVFSAIFNFIGTIVSSKSASTAVCILTVCTVILTASIVKSMLAAPETIDNVYQNTEDGESIVNTIPNPDYVSGAKRERLEFIDKYAPGGQALMYSGLGDCKEPGKQILAAAVWVVAFTAAGSVLFRRKDIK